MPQRPAATLSIGDFQVVGNTIAQEKFAANRANWLLIKRSSLDFAGSST